MCRSPAWDVDDDAHAAAAAASEDTENAAVELAGVSSRLHPVPKLVGEEDNTGRTVIVAMGGRRALDSKVAEKDTVQNTGSADAAVVEAVLRTLEENSTAAQNTAEALARVLEALQPELGEHVCPSQKMRWSS